MRSQYLAGTGQLLFRLAGPLFGLGGAAQGGIFVFVGGAVAFLGTSDSGLQLAVLLVQAVDIGKDGIAGGFGSFQLGQQVLILLVGHGLNMAMAALSILVHAVRLNTLEFSNHKGVSWAGYVFRPFQRHLTNKGTPT